MVCSCYEQATDVQHMTTGEDTMGKSVVIPLHGDNIHLQHLFHPEALAPLVDRSAPARCQLATLSALISPAQGDYWDSTGVGT